MELEPLLVLLRSHGIARYEADGISVEFHAEQQSTRTGFMQDMLKSAPAAAQPPDDETCTCGHKILTDHNEQGCLHGCEIDTCGRQGTAGDDA